MEDFEREKPVHVDAPESEVVSLVTKTNGLAHYSGPLEEYISGHLLVVADKNSRLETLKNDTPYSNRVLNHFRIPDSVADYASEEEKKEWQTRSKCKENVQLLRSFIAGSPVLDIGAGSTENGYVLACLGGATAYYAIEPFFGERLVMRLEGFRQANRLSDDPLPEIPFLCIAEDIRTAINRFPDDSLSIMSFGMDSNVLGRLSVKSRNDLIENIIKKLSPKGVYVSGAVDSLRSDNLVRLDITDELEGDVAFFSKTTL